MANSNPSAEVIKATISIPFEENHYPEMPLNISSYRFDHDGDEGSRPLKGYFSLVFEGEDYILTPSSGTVTINFDLPEGELVHKTQIPFDGVFERIELVTISGDKSVEVAGSFEELGSYTPATVSSLD